MPNIDMTRIITAEDRSQAAAKAEARQTLTTTDWMVIRRIETGQDLPDGVLEARAAARQVLGRAS